MSRSLVVNVLVAALAVLVVATVIGLVALWPRDATIPAPEGSVSTKTERAEVTAVSRAACTIPGATSCARVTAKLRTGRDSGESTSFTFVGRQIPFSLGDEIRVFRNPQPPGNVAVEPYGFSDFERRQSLFWLALGFALLVLFTARLRGLRALVGLAASLAIVVFFIVPAILDGRSPAVVALVGALAVMFATIPLAHGLGAKTIAACLGTAASLGLTLALADLFVDLAHLSGMASEEAVFVQASTREVSLSGLLVAGMLIAALGVLDDLTVTQSSTVLALRRANPALGFTRLFRSALDVGHDHITATVNTLVLAYVGAALPVLLVFHIGSVPFGDAVNFEVVAAEIVGTLVGSIGLVAAVPVTTGLAAVLALRLEPSAVGDVHVH